MLPCLPITNFQIPKLSHKHTPWQALAMEIKIPDLTKTRSRAHSLAMTHGNMHMERDFRLAMTHEGMHALEVKIPDID